MPLEFRPRLRTVAGAAALALVPFALTACSGDPEQTPAPASTAPSAAESSAPGLPEGVTPAPIPTKVANDPDDRKNVVLTDCKATDDGWGASGTATNPGKDAVTYTVTVFFTTTSATTINSARTEVDVDAGKTVRWTADKKFTHPADVLCVLRGVAAD